MLSSGAGLRPVSSANEARRQAATKDRVREYFGMYGQAIKRIRWMPRRSVAMKDVTACEKPWGAGNKL
jgi:hypothetical protein